jgi:phenylacetate-CoA ligase
MTTGTTYLYFEIIDRRPANKTCRTEMGELDITTLRKEGAPLIRYRTHELTRIIPENPAPAARNTPASAPSGRTDDMVKVKGTIIYPASSTSF